LCGQFGCLFSHALVRLIFSVPLHEHAVGVLAALSVLLFPLPLAGADVADNTSLDISAGAGVFGVPRVGRHPLMAANAKDLWLLICNEPHNGAIAPETMRMLHFSVHLAFLLALRHSEPVVKVRSPRSCACVPFAFFSSLRSQLPQMARGGRTLAPSQAT